MADFIITSLQSWDIEIGSTIKNTALEISKTHKVFYINTPPNIVQWIRKFKKISSNKNKRINDNLHIIYCKVPVLPANCMPFKWLFNMANFINNYIIAITIKKTIHHYNIKNYTHIIDTDIFRSRYLKQLIHPTITIYYRRDYVIGVEYWKKYGPKCEQALVQQSDIIITNSSYFTKELKSLNPYILTTNTGVNLELYNACIQYEIPVDLASIPHPIIGYTGAIIERRLNSELLYAVAKQLPDYNFIFVGPEDKHFKSHPLHQLKNVYFLGHRKVEELPQYIQYFDVCINPQLINLITEGNYPLKIDEYLAMGKPIIATETHTMRDVFSQYTHLANTPEEWINALKIGVNETNDKQLAIERIAFAHTHSWAHSVEKIYQAINLYQNSIKKRYD